MGARPVLSNNKNKMNTMETFLKLHPFLVSDLRKTAEILRDYHYDTVADGCEAYAKEIENYKPEPRFLLQTNAKKASWKKWQTETHKLAETYELQTFTREEIEAFVKRLNEYAHTFKNCTEEIEGPDLDFYENFGYDKPWMHYISIGQDCYLTLIPIKKNYDGK